jgi:hypothetical protein
MYVPGDDDSRVSKGALPMQNALKIALLVCLCSFASVVWAAPKLVVKQTEYDFGQVYQGESVQHAFLFSNQGDEPLLVTKVRSSCGCTAALVSSRELKPGESGEIQANFDSTRFQGKISKTIYLYTNDTTQPVAQLYIKGAVKEMVQITPKQINFGTVPPEQPVIAELTLLNQGNQTLTFEEPTTTAYELKASLEATQLEAGQQTRVTLKFVPKQGQARFSGYVTVKVSGGVQKDLRIPVYAMIKP